MQEAKSLGIFTLKFFNLELKAIKLRMKPTMNIWNGQKGNSKLTLKGQSNHNRTRKALDISSIQGIVLDVFDNY